MKSKILLLVATLSFTALLNAQTSKQITGYAITAPQKGQTGWKEVRLVDITTGEELQAIYKSNDQIEILNARTGKPVKNIESTPVVQERKVVNLDMELDKKDLERKIAQTVQGNIQAYTIDANNKLQAVTARGNGHVETITKNGQVYVFRTGNGFEMNSNKPFATNSAACAYDKKHERLYYTPMGINQLRYIDLKTKKIYYFEDEPFGTVNGIGDGANQIPRMVIASDGNGYALSNNCEHLMRFTTGKKPEITDLGALTDDAVNGSYSVKNSGGYGGDIIADANKNLYLVTGNRNVFRISIENKVATYTGTIKGLPRGFTTNGAMVEEGSKVIVCSSQSTEGYFRFDLITMQAEKVSNGNSVFNASDLASSTLAFEKKKKDRKEDKQQPKEDPKVVTAEKITPQNMPEEEKQGSIALYPNPATNGFVKVEFTDQPAGHYLIQLMDISGKLLGSQEVNLTNKLQVEEFRLPKLIASGNYLLKIVSDANKISVVNQLVVQ